MGGSTTRQEWLELVSSGSEEAPGWEAVQDLVLVLQTLKRTGKEGNKCVCFCVCVHNHVVHEYTHVHVCARGVCACLPLPAAVFPIPFVCVPVSMCTTVYKCVCADTGTMWYCTCTCCLVSVGTCVHVCNVHVRRLVHWRWEEGAGPTAANPTPSLIPRPSFLLPSPGCYAVSMAAAPSDPTFTPVV